MPTSPTSSPARASATSRCRTRRSGWRCSGCATSSANAEDPGRNGGRNLAYALYVLARNGAAPVGDLRYFVDTKLDDFATTIAKAQLAAALGMLGDKVRAERVYTAALRSMAPQPTLEYGRVDYGSILRDGAALITLASEGGAPRATITGAIERVEAARGLTPYTSTQENAWMVLAARALAKDATNVSLDVAGEKRQGALNRRFLPSQLQKPLRIANAGEGPLQAVVTVNGAPLVPEPAADRGFKIERLYFTLDGKPADPSKARQNDRFAVVLRITEPQPQFGRVIVADYLPAGFEIDNPRLVSSGETGTLPWIQDGADAGEFGVPRRPLQRRVQPQERRSVGVHRGLYRAGGVAGDLRASAGVRGGHVPSRPLRPHRHRHRRGDGGAMSDSATNLVRHSGARAQAREPGATAA